MYQFGGVPRPPRIYSPVGEFNAELNYLLKSERCDTFKIDVHNIAAQNN